MANEAKEWFGHYHTCYGLMPLPKTGALRPVYVGDHDGRYGVVSCVLYTKSGAKKNMQYVISDLMKLGKWFLPDCRLFNGSKQAAYYTVTPMRQYTKGISRMEFQYVGAYPLSIPQHSADVELAWGWGREYPTFDGALNELETGNMVSCAFSKYWAVGAVYGMDYPALFYRRDAVGVILPNGEIELESAYSMFAEHLGTITNRKIAYVG